MRKVLSLLFAIALFASSCSKQNREELPTITSEQTLQLRSGETVSIPLPTENTDDAYAIIVNSGIGGTVSVNDNVVTYTAPNVATPVTDEVACGNDHNEEHHGEHQGGGCNGGSKKGGHHGGKHHRKEKADQHYRVNLHIQVSPVDIEPKNISK